MNTMEMNQFELANHIKIGVIGMGYVGLPLARLFSTKFKTIGYDLNSKRVGELMTGTDSTLEVPDTLLQEAINKHGSRYDRRSLHPRHREGFWSDF